MVSFLGGAGCLFCRAHVIRLIQARDAIAQAGGNVIFVVYDDPELVMSRMMHDLELPWVLMVDADRHAYSAWGLRKATLKNKLRPGLYWASAKVIARLLTGRERNIKKVPGPPQLGGDFVVDREGRLAFENRMKSFHDRASVDDLLAAMRSDDA